MELLTEFLGKTINLPAESIQEKLYKKQEDGTFSNEFADNALETLLELDRERVSKLKSIDNADITKFKNMGKAEALTNFEKQIKELYKVEEDVKGVDLIQSIVRKTSSTKMTDDQVKLHPLFIALENQKNNEINTFKSTYEDEINKLKNEFTSKEINSKVNDIAIGVLDTMKPILSSDPAKANNVKKLFLSQISSEYQFQNVDGNIIPVKDGKRAEDEHGNALTLDKLVQRKAMDFFEFEQQDPKGSAGNQGGTTPPLVVPKTKEELSAMIFNEPDAAKRLALSEAFKKANPNL